MECHILRRATPQLGDLSRSDGSTNQLENGAQAVLAALPAASTCRSSQIAQLASPSVCPLRIGLTAAANPASLPVGEFVTYLSVTASRTRTDSVGA